MLFKGQAELLRAHEEQRARRDKTVPLTGVEATTSVGNLGPSTGELGLTGHVPTVVVTDLSVALNEQITVSDTIGRKPFFGNTNQSGVATVEHWRAARRQPFDSSYSFYLDSNAILFPQTRTGAVD